MVKQNVLQLKSLKRLFMNAEVINRDDTVKIVDDINDNNKKYM